MEPDPDLEQPHLAPRQRGKASAARLAVVPDVRLAQPPAPPELSDRERALWEQLTSRTAPGLFWVSENLLAAYVRVSVQLERLGAGISQQAPGSKRWIELVKLQNEVIRQAVGLARALRLSPHASRDRYLKVAESKPRVRPWEDV
jgi:hypothetical protein